MGHASSTAPIAGAPTTPMQLVEHLKYLLDHAQVNLDEFCDAACHLIEQTKLSKLGLDGTEDQIVDDIASKVEAGTNLMGWLMVLFSIYLGTGVACLIYRLQHKEELKAAAEDDPTVTIPRASFATDAMP